MTASGFPQPRHRRSTSRQTSGNAYMSFGARLGHMQSLAGLAAVLARFTVQPAPETSRHLVSDPRSTIVQNIIGGIPLLFLERTAAHKQTSNIPSPA